MCMDMHCIIMFVRCSCQSIVQLPHVERPALLQSILEGTVSEISDTLNGKKLLV